MSQKLDILRAAGCDVTGALERCINDESFYLDCLSMAFRDASFEGLGKALEAHDVTAAFECAHSLKGVLANMGLTPLYEIVVEIVEPLRAGCGDGLLPAYRRLLSARSELLARLENA